MAASSILLRTLRVAGTERVLCSPGSTLYAPFLPHGRSHLLVCRSFSAQALQASEPSSISNENRSSKKKVNAGSSWEEAGQVFFSSKNRKNERDNDSGDSGNKVVSIGESAQSSRSNRSNVEEGSAGSSISSKSDRNKGRSTDVFDEGKLRNGQRGYGRGREEYMDRSRADDAGFTRKQFFNSDNGRGSYRSKDSRGDDIGFRRQFSDADNGRGGNRSFRKEFSNGEEDRSLYRGNARRGDDARWADRSNGRRGGFREESWGMGDERRTSRDNSRGGGFREEFSKGVDGRSTYKSGGNLGKKQFPDLDGGKRLFKGRFQGDGFVKKQQRDDEDDFDVEDAGAYRARKGERIGRPPGRRFQDEEDADALSEEDDEESEDFPEAGDVIKYSDMSNTKSTYNKRLSRGSASSGSNKLQEEEEGSDEDEDEDEDGNESGYGRQGYRLGRRELPTKGSPLPRLKGEVLYGVGPVYAALQISRREFFCLYVQANMPIGGGSTNKKKDKKALEWIIRSAVDRGLEVKEVSKHDLNMLADNRPHQGLILDVSPLQLVLSSGLDAPFEENGKAPVWVALDEVTDPQNFGAILRSAYFLGAAGVVVCAKNSAPLSAVVSKASAGALEMMELRSCKNMMKFLDKSTENGWRVVGGSASGVDVTPVRELPRGLPTILVLGGEGKGLRTNVKRCCSDMVCIPGLASDSLSKEGSVANLKDAGSVAANSENTRNVLIGAGEDFIAVESLNVSVAAGILLHELLNVQSSAECSTATEAVVRTDEGVEALSVVLNAQEENSTQETVFTETG